MLIALFLHITPWFTVPLSGFYPYGVSEGYTALPAITLPANDDGGSGEISTLSTRGLKTSESNRNTVQESNFYHVTSNTFQNYSTRALKACFRSRRRYGLRYYFFTSRPVSQFLWVISIRTESAKETQHFLLMTTAVLERSQFQFSFRISTGITILYLWVNMLYLLFEYCEISKCYSLRLYNNCKDLEVCYDLSVMRLSM